MLLDRFVGQEDAPSGIVTFGEAMSEFRKCYKGDTEEIVKQIVQASKVVGNLLSAYDEVRGPVRILFRVYEKYFMRTNSTASLSILIIIQENEVDLKAVTSGSGSGIFNLDMGAANALIRDFQNELRAQGLK